VAFDNVFASPLSRTLDTACIVSGLPADRVCITKEFQEIDLGDWDGVEVRCIKDQYPQAWDARGKDMAGFRPPGGESFSDLEARVMPAFVGLVSGMPGNCLVVAHAGVNRVILTRLLGKNLEDLFSIPQGYGALNIIHSRNLCVQSVNLLPQ
jgi:probable phosphoglycerate mutase